MDKECDVIITYCWNSVGYNILRSLASHGLKVWVSDISAKNICSLSKFCTGSFVYPDYTKDERAFIACLKQKVIELKPKMLLPTHDESVVIMRYRKEFPKELIIPYETEKLLLMLADKASSTKIAERVGIPVPKVYYSVKEVKEYPVVFKTVIGNSAKGVYFPKNKDELEILIQKYKDESTLLEQWIGGTDYSVDCVRCDGFWKSAVYHAIITKTKGGGQPRSGRLSMFRNWKDSLDYYLMRWIFMEYVDWIFVMILLQGKLPILRLMLGLLEAWLLLFVLALIFLGSCINWLRKVIMGKK